MRTHRYLAAGAVPALFVSLLIVLPPIAARAHSEPGRVQTAGRHAVVSPESPLAPTTVFTTEQSKRALTFGALVAFLAAALSITLALLLRRGGDARAERLILSAGLGRRGRSPPLARA